MKIKISSILPLTFVFIFVFLHSIKVYADDGTRLLQYGMVITYAGLCGQRMNVPEDEAASQEATNFGRQLVSRVGQEQALAILSTSAVLGAQTFEKDNGSQCLQMLTAAKKIFNEFGIRGIYFEKVLARYSQNSRNQKSPSKPNAYPSDASPQKGRLKLTDNLHNQFLAEDNDYALADAMLNATWKMVKKNLDKSAFASVQKDQREWASSKRDERAASYAASIPPSQAYTKVMQERIAELSSLIAKEPRMGDYEGERQMFNIYKDKGEYQIDGSADNAAGNTCMFEGKLIKDGGWYKVHEDGLPPYYVLFTDKGAFIQYLGSGSEHGCGANVGFNGEYKFVK